MLKRLSIILISLVMLLGIIDVGAEGNNVDGSAFLGEWHVVRQKLGGNEFDAGNYDYRMSVMEGGNAMLYSAGDTELVEWEAKSPSSGKINDEYDSYEMTVQGDELTLELQDDYILIFERIALEAGDIAPEFTGDWICVEGKPDLDISYEEIMEIAMGLSISVYEDGTCTVFIDGTSYDGIWGIAEEETIHMYLLGSDAMEIIRYEDGYLMIENTPENVSLIKYQGGEGEEKEYIKSWELTEVTSDYNEYDKEQLVEDGLYIVLEICGDNTLVVYSGDNVVYGNWEEDENGKLLLKANNVTEEAYMEGDKLKSISGMMEYTFNEAKLFGEWNLSYVRKGSDVISADDMKESGTLEIYVDKKIDLDLGLEGKSYNASWVMTGVDALDVCIEDVLYTLKLDGEELIMCDELGYEMVFTR